MNDEQAVRYSRTIKSLYQEIHSASTIRLIWEAPSNDLIIAKSDILLVQEFLNDNLASCGIPILIKRLHVYRRLYSADIVHLN